MKVIKKRHDTQMHFFFNFDFITAAVWQLIFAQMTFAIDRPRSTVGLEAKNPPKIQVQNSLKLNYHTYACNSLTNFEDQVWTMTGNGNCVNVLRFAGRHSWNHIMWINVRPFLGSSNHCVDSVTKEGATACLSNSNFCSAHFYIYVIFAIFTLPLLNDCSTRASS